MVFSNIIKVQRQGYLLFQLMYLVASKVNCKPIKASVAKYSFLKGKKNKRKEAGKPFRCCLCFSVQSKLSNNSVHTPSPLGIAFIELSDLLCLQPAEKFSQRSALINLAVLQRLSGTHHSPEKGEKNDKLSTTIINLIFRLKGSP